MSSSRQVPKFVMNTPPPCLGTFALKMEAVCLSETLVPIYETVWSHVPEHLNMDLHHHENLKCHVAMCINFMRLKNAYARS
jgi:hypothetical protein